MTVSSKIKKLTWGVLCGGIFLSRNVSCETAQLWQMTSIFLHSGSSSDCRLSFDNGWVGWLHQRLRHCHLICSSSCFSCESWRHLLVAGTPNCDPFVLDETFFFFFTGAHVPQLGSLFYFAQIAIKKMANLQHLEFQMTRVGTLMRCAPSGAEANDKGASGGKERQTCVSNTRLSWCKKNKNKTLPQWQDSGCQNSGSCSVIVKLSASLKMEKITHSTSLWEETVIAVNVWIKYDSTRDFKGGGNVCDCEHQKDVCLFVHLFFSPWLLLRAAPSPNQADVAGHELNMPPSQNQETASHMSLRVSESKLRK